MLQISKRTFAAGALVLLASGAAFGQASPLQFNFTYQRLSGNYSNATSTFTADAVNIPSQIASEGIVSRNATPGGTANFLSGFAGAPGSAAGFNLTLSVFNRVGPTASGIGTITGTDVFGNKFTGNVGGDRSVDPSTGWSALGSFIFFQGTLSNVVFTPAAPGNQLFTGSDGSNFNFTTFPGAQPFNGAIVTLSIVNSGGFFNSDFGVNSAQGIAVPTQVSGQLVPTPAGAALLGLAGIAAAGRRRRS